MSDDIILLRSIESFTVEEYRAEYRKQPEEMKKRLDALSETRYYQTLAGRILLRHLVTERYSRKNFTVTYNENGKPLLKNGYCSISHAGFMVGCTLSEYPVGLDLEPYRKLDYVERCPIFTPEENEFVASGEDPNERFLLVWTRKEAYAKREGVSLTAVARECVLNDTPWASFRTERVKDFVVSTCRPWDYCYDPSFKTVADLDKNQ